MQSATRTAAAGLIGNVLEWFDYAVYGYFSTEIGKQFFPAAMDSTTKELLTYAVFWLGFAARPIGGFARTSGWLRFAHRCPTAGHTSRLARS